MGEFEAARLRAAGARVGLEEPYQHYHFAGRVDVLAFYAHQIAGIARILRFAPDGVALPQGLSVASRARWPAGFEDELQAVDLVHLFAHLLEAELIDQPERRLIVGRDRGHEGTDPVS